MDRSIAGIAYLVTRHPRWVTAVLLLIAAVAALGYTQRREPWRSFLAEQKASGTDSAMQTLQEVKDEFGLQRPECFILLRADDLLTRENVRAIRRMVAALESLEQVESVFWIDDIPVMNVFGLADPLLPPEGGSEESFRRARERLVEHPLISGQLLAEDGRTIMLPLQLAWLSHRSDEEVNAELLRVAREALAAEGPSSKGPPSKGPPNEGAAAEDRQIEVQLTGDVPLFQDQIAAYRRNQRKFQVIGYVLVFSLSAFLFRGVIPILIVGAAPMYAIFITFGFMRWAGAGANPMTDAVLPVLLALMGVTDGVHLMLHLRLQRAEHKSAAESIRIALREVGSACVMTSVTTAVGFASLMMAHSEFVRDFGLACSLGVLVTLLAVLIVIPLLTLSPLGNNLHRGLAKDIVYGNIGRLGPVIDWIIRRPKRVALFGVLITIGFGVVGSFMRPDSRLASSLPSSSASFQAMEVADRELGGIELARLVVRWPEEMTWDDPRILAATREAQAIIEAESTLSNPISFLNVLSSFPTTNLEESQQLGMLDLLPVQLRESFLQRDARQVLISFRAQDLGVGRYQHVFERIDRQLDELAEEHPGFEFALTGDFVVRCRTIFQVVEDLARSLTAASVVIFVMIAVAFRSLKYGLLSLLPNLFPLATTAFLLVILDRPLNVSTVCAFTVCLGMAVDDTIHFLNRYVRLRAEGQSVSTALRTGFLQVGAALLMTTFVLLVGFATVMTSELPSQRIFAAMACCTIGTALLGDMIFFPALLAWFDRPRRAGEPAAAPTGDTDRVDERVGPADAFAESR